MSKRKDTRAYTKVQLTPYMLGVLVKERTRKEECTHPQGYYQDIDHIARCVDCTNIINPEEWDYAYENGTLTEDPDNE